MEASSSSSMSSMRILGGAPPGDAGRLAPREGSDVGALAGAAVLKAAAAATEAAHDAALGLLSRIARSSRIEWTAIRCSRSCST